MLTTNETLVLSTIIISLETGGQVYGKGDWGCFGEAYQTTSAEHAISIGACQWMGTEALTLLKKIYSKDPTTFKKLDTAGVYSDFSKDWSCYQVSRNSAKAKCIISIISSPSGIICQKELLGIEMNKYAEQAQALGVTDHIAQAECCNFHHHGGYGAMKRIIDKTPKPYTLDHLYNAVLTDTGENQIGTYTNRQKACYNMIKKYWPTSNTAVNKPSVSANTTSTSSSTKLNTTAKWTGYIKTKTNVRTWAGSENPVLKSINTLGINNTVGVCDTVKDVKKYDWYYVVINGKTYGFVPANNVSKTKVVETKTPTTSSSSKLNTKSKWTGTVTADTLNVRVWAGTENDKLKSIPTIKCGTKVGVCDTVKAKDGSAWYYVLINGKTYGFVSSAYIKK